MDLMLVTATEDIDENQIFFENTNKRYESRNRIVDEYVLDEWDIFRRIEESERNKISDRQQAIRRISNILEKIPSNEIGRAHV